MPYLFFLGGVPLPITPSALSIKTPSLNRTVTLVNEGEINIPKGAGLREISFEFLLPRLQKYPFANYHIPYYTATIMTKLLSKWKELMLPFRFIVVRTSPKYLPLDYEYIKCLVEDFSFEEDAESHGFDVMCSITLKEYKDYGTKILDKEPDSDSAKVSEERSTENKETKSSTTAKKGDTAPNVAKKETGSFNNADSIASENGAAVGNPYGDTTEGWKKFLEDASALAEAEEAEMKALAIDLEQETLAGGAATYALNRATSTTSTTSLTSNNVQDVNLGDSDFETLMEATNGRFIAYYMINVANSVKSTGNAISMLELMEEGNEIKLPISKKQSLATIKSSVLSAGGAGSLV